jgi:hypothetical protein
MPHPCEDELTNLTLGTLTTAQSLRVQWHIFHWLALDRNKSRTITPESISTLEAGSGTLVTPDTFTLPPLVVKAILSRFESSKITPETGTVIALVPLPMAVNWKLASLPLPVTPETKPVSLSAVALIKPPTLSMVPGMNEPSLKLERNSPLLTDTAKRMVGSNVNSN